MTPSPTLSTRRGGIGWGTTNGRGSGAEEGKAWRKGEGARGKKRKNKRSPGREDVQ